MITSILYLFLPISKARFRTHTPELLINCIQQQLDLAKEHGLDEAVMIPLATVSLLIN